MVIIFSRLRTQNMCLDKEFFKLICEFIHMKSHKGALNLIFH